jgi:hypothetical protein
LRSKRAAFARIDKGVPRDAGAGDGVGAGAAKFTAARYMASLEYGVG